MGSQALETAKVLSAADITLIVTGIIMGTTARIITSKVDLRQVPTYPSAYFNNIVLGLIASALGAIAIYPARGGNPLALLIKKSEEQKQLVLDLGRALMADTVQLKNGDYILNTKEGKG